jgi:hypothetical protein
MRFIKRFLIVENQPIIMLSNGKPCSHCRNQKQVQMSDHLVSWEIPRALIIYAGEDVDAMCVECLEAAVHAED